MCQPGVLIINIRAMREGLRYGRTSGQYTTVQPVDTLLVGGLATSDHSPILSHSHTLLLRQGVRFCDWLPEVSPSGHAER